MTSEGGGYTRQMTRPKNVPVLETRAGIRLFRRSVCIGAAREAARLQVLACSHGANGDDFAIAGEKEPGGQLIPEQGRGEYEQQHTSKRRDGQHPCGLENPHLLPGPV